MRKETEEIADMARTETAEEMGYGEQMPPEAFRERMRKMLGEEYGVFAATFGRERHQAFRLNPLKLMGQKDMEAFSRLEKVPWAKQGYYYGEEMHPGKHPYHQAGLYYIQEPSAMVPAALLEPKPGERILDLCAAPGGKSTQIAAEMEGRGLLICNEIHPARAKILSENIERMGICNACVTNETPGRLAEVFPEYFDRILVDAPCSGEGMFRKNQTACEEWSLENVAMCASRQDEILDCAARMLRPGGRLVYSTCTFSVEENEGSVSRFITRHPEYRILPVEKESLGLAGCDGLPGQALHPEDTVRMWPHRIRGEGHFAAVLQKCGTWPEGYSAVPACGVVKGVPLKELGEYVTFCRENLRMQEPELRAGGKCYIRYGENLYLVPADMPSMKGLKVLRPGLHMGELRKNRFEPSHGLALALSPKAVTHFWNLESGEDTVNAYLKGQTFPAEGEKGWYLICVDGFSLGWGKLAGAVMKNHYPKGLRLPF